MTDKSSLKTDKMDKVATPCKVTLNFINPLVFRVNDLAEKVQRKLTHFNCAETWGENVKTT